jgi:hypothetical protein
LETKNSSPYAAGRDVPGDDQSAGKRRGGQARSGSPWLRQALVEAAQAAGRTNDT